MADPPPDNRLRHKFAALGAIGSLMVLLPLGELLRHQSAEVHALLAERAVLDPMARALAVQRGLLDHREVAGAVLTGRKALEPERRLRQAEVDARVAALAGTLASGAWERALDETTALGTDWHELAHRVVARRIAAPQSDQAHTLLVEQALQVMDLVNARAAGDTQANAYALALQRQALPRDTRYAAQAEQALVQRSWAIDEKVAHLRSRRAALATAMAVLALLGAGLAWRLTRALAAARVPPAGPPPGTGSMPQPRGDTNRAVAGRLMQRLRQGTPAAGTDSAEAPAPTPPPSAPA
jgi:hypothetical protein